mgnify:CR=1 FL=1
MYTIRVDDNELHELLCAIVDATAANMDTLTKHIAAGQTSGLECFIDQDAAYQHIFNLVLYAHKEGGETNAE